MIDMAAIDAALDQALEFGFEEDAESKDWRAFNKLMPKLYEARNQGMSYHHHTTLFQPTCIWLISVLMYASADSLRCSVRWV